MSTEILGIKDQHSSYQDYIFLSSKIQRIGKILSSEIQGIKHSGWHLWKGLKIRIIWKGLKVLKNENKSYFLKMI